MAAPSEPEPVMVAGLGSTTPKIQDKCLRGSKKLTCQRRVNASYYPHVLERLSIRKDMYRRDMHSNGIGQ